MIKIYSTSWCPSCNAAKQLLTSKGMEYEEINIEEIDINVEVDLDLGGFMGTSDHSDGSYKSVRLNAVLHGDLTEEQAKTVGQKVDARCPILALLRTSGCKIESSWSKK